MKLTNRSPFQIEQDRYTISELLKKGYRTAYEIAQLINARENRDVPISQAQVQADITTLKQDLRTRAVDNMQEVRNHLIDCLWDVYKQQEKGYELSKKNEVIIESEQVEDVEGYGVLLEGSQIQDEGLFTRNVKIRERTRPEGNYNFLSGKIQTLDRISKIYGVDAPSKIALTDPSGEKEAESPLQQIMQKLSVLDSKNKTELPESNDIKELPSAEKTGE